MTKVRYVKNTEGIYDKWQKWERKASDVKIKKKIEICENSYTFIGLFFTHPDWYNKIK